MNGLIQGPPARPCPPTAFPYRCVKLPKIPPLECCVSSAQKSMLFPPGRGPSSHSCIFRDRGRGESTPASALRGTYSETMVSGSPSRRDSSACSPTGKLPKATALALLLSGWRDRDGHPLARREFQWRLGSHHQSSHGHPRAACLLGSWDGNLESDAFP